MSDNSSAQGSINKDSNQAVAAASSQSVDKDFVILCPLQDSGLDEAILALYYLPPQFKLRVLINATTTEMPFGDYDAVKGRISVENATGMPLEGSLFSDANAVVYSEHTPVKSESQTPRVVISKTITDTFKEEDGRSYTVTENSPEALASAMLRIAKFA